MAAGTLYTKKDTGQLLIIGGKLATSSDCCCVEISDDPCTVCVTDTTPEYVTLHSFTGISKCDAGDHVNCPATCIDEAIATLTGSSWTLQNSGPGLPCLWSINGNFDLYQLSGDCTTYALYIWFGLTYAAGTLGETVKVELYKLNGTWATYGQMFYSATLTVMAQPDCRTLDGAGTNTYLSGGYCHCPPPTGGAVVSYGGTCAYRAGD